MYRVLLAERTSLPQRLASAGFSSKAYTSNGLFQFKINIITFGSTYNTSLLTSTVTSDAETRSYGVYFVHAYETSSLNIKSTRKLYRFK